MIQLTSLTARLSVYERGQNPPPVPPGHRAFAQVPSRAFGDGSHPTTRLCAGAIDLIGRLERPSSLLDVGTGTGILARIARAAGCPFVCGTDIDPEAIRAARLNFALDPETTELSVLDAPPDAWGARFDVVVANILEAPLRELAPAIARALRPGGTLLISGFTPFQEPALVLRYAEHGLNLESRAGLDGWALLRFRRPV